MQVQKGEVSENQLASYRELIAAQTEEKIRAMREKSYAEEAKAFAEMMSAQQQFSTFVSSSEQAPISDRIEAVRELARIQEQEIEKQFFNEQLTYEQMSQYRILLEQQTQDRITQIQEQSEAQRIAKRKQEGFLGGGQLRSDIVDVQEDLPEFFRKETVEGIDSAYQDLRSTLTSTFADAIKGAKSFEEAQQALFMSLINNIINLISQMLAAIAVAAALNVLTGGAFAGAGAAVTGASGGLGLLGGASSAAGAGGGGESPGRSSLAGNYVPAQKQESVSNTFVSIQAVDAKSVKELFDGNPDIITNSLRTNISQSPGTRRSIRNA